MFVPGSVTAQNRALEVIGQMPQDASLADIIEKLNFIKDVDDGFQQIESGDSITHEEVKRRMAKWLTK